MVNRTGAPIPLDVTKLFLCGDVMLGRGIDQLFERRSRPELREGYLHDARDYVALCEQIHGPIKKPVDFSYVWGEALEELDRWAPDVRLINLETSVTTSEHCWPQKGIHYRVHPANASILTRAQIDVCALSNNHMLDFGREGLLETLETLTKVGIGTAGGGRNLETARHPARVKLQSGGELLFWSVGSETSGIFADWAAGADRPGLDLLPDLSEQTAAGLAQRIRLLKGPGDLAIVSIHWGSNWGFDLVNEQVDFAHRLIEAGADVVHGHSSHHARPIEVYRNKLILYGCGDFINDYEGIGGFEAFRSDLRLMYLASLSGSTGALEALRIVPFQTYKLSLRRASHDDCHWLSKTLTQASQTFSTQILPASDGTLLVQQRPFAHRQDD